MLSKGSKKWIEDQTTDQIKSEMFIDHQRNRKIDDLSNITLSTDETQTFDHQKLSTTLNGFNRHESANASLLVEAALDSVCSEPNIDIDVSSTSNCPDALVNNLYTLAHPDTLPDVTYSHSDVNESRDINLISPSVNDHISVTDDLNEELRHPQNIALSYSTFHQDDFSPANSPIQNRNNFVRDYINPVSPQDVQNYEDSHSKNASPSPPRYDFGHTVNNPDHLSSDDSNGIGVQNLSLHNPKDNIHLDLSIYKSPYSVETSFPLRKDFRMKFDIEPEQRKQVYILDVDEMSKSYNSESNKCNVDVNEQNQVENLEVNSLNGKEFDSIEGNDLKCKEDLESRSNLNDLRTSKFDIDIDLRMKNYETLENDLRTRGTYDNIDDFRKGYELENGDARSNMDIRNKLYDGLMESDFRIDRNFEPLVLNSELQGLDMSARSYHTYSNLNRYHHLYPEVDRANVDLRMNYSPPPPPYSHADILRVVSLDLTPPGRHSVDLSLRSHQITNSRLLTDPGIQPNSHRLSLDQSRILSSDLSSSRHLSTDSRLISVSDMSNRILSDHTTNRILSNDQLSTNRLISADQRLIGEDSRLITEQPRLLEQGRLLGESRILAPTPGGGSISPVPYASYSVSPSPYHPTTLPHRPHPSTSPPYHHYTTYY